MVDGKVSVFVKDNRPSLRTVIGSNQIPILLGLLSWFLGTFWSTFVVFSRFQQNSENSLFNGAACVIWVRSRRGHVSILTTSDMLFLCLCDVAWPNLDRFELKKEYDRANRTRLRIDDWLSFCTLPLSTAVQRYIVVWRS